MWDIILSYYCLSSEISDEVADIKDTKDEMCSQIMYDAGAPKPEG